MTAAGSSLNGIVEQELRLPEIDGEACVHARLEQAQCSACVEACPREAWILDEDALGLDVEACDGCGLCMPACPTGALHIHLPWVIRSLGGNMVALFACERSPAEDSRACIPCIHALGLRQLLLLYTAGVHFLLLSRGDCESCSRNSGERIQQRIDGLNRLLGDRRRPGMKLLEHSPSVWQKIYRTDEVVTRGTRLGRREFLREPAAQVRRQLVVLDPFNLPECRTLPPAELLPDATAGETSWPWLPALDPRRCNGCDACTRLCPTGALSISLETEETEACYEVDAARCNGCNICTAVCDSEAIGVAAGTASRTTHIGLATAQCHSCGNSFHLPREHPSLGDGLCRICREKDHTRLLFQVLES